MKKLAVLRSNSTENKCPFGLNINSACKKVGNTIRRMTPLQSVEPDDLASVKKSNKTLYLWQATGEPCPFANKVFEQHSKMVNCNYGEADEGDTQKGAIEGSPFYTKMFEGVALDGLFSVPLGFYVDNNISRNMYYGIYSLQGSQLTDEQRKIVSEIINMLTKK